MITIKEFLEATQYRITAGSEFIWDCYGRNARYLDCGESPDGDTEYSASIVYDTETQVVYVAELWDYKRKRYYRYFCDSEYRELYRTESEKRHLDFDEAFDEAKYTDLDCPVDFLAKVSAVFREEDYPDDVTVFVDIDDENLFELMKQAHEKDITLNMLLNQLISEMVEREKNQNIN